MKIKLSPLAICLAFGLSAVAGAAQANWISDYMKMKHKNKNKHDDPVQLPVEPPPGNSHPSYGKGYPNGRGWTAVKYDFIIVKEKIDDVKEDTEEILLELDDIDADLGDLLDGQEALMDGQEVLSDQIEDLAGAVEDQGNVLEVQVRVGAITEDDVSIDSSSSVILYVQVIQNGEGLDGLKEIAFTYSNGAPKDAADICKVDCVTGLGNGLYMVELETAAGVTGDFAGTLAVSAEGDDASIDSDNSNGASIVTFEIEESDDASIDPV